MSVETLQRRLRADPDDDETWQVYGDWLTDRGDPRGRLIALEHRLTGVAAANGSDTRDVVRRIEVEIEQILADREAWLGGWDTRLVHSSLGELVWRNGFIIGATWLDASYPPWEDSLLPLIGVVRGSNGELLREVRLVWSPG